jgi:hypothetical protein
MKIKTIKTSSEEIAEKNMPLKLKSISLIKKLYSKIAKDKEPDDMIIMELEAMGFKVYPPTRYA